jgi:hypothetical protein
MEKYLSLDDSSFALRYFLMEMASPQCDTPLVVLGGADSHLLVPHMILPLSIVM